MKRLEVVLASQSPRRQELLKFLLDSFTIRVSDVEETLPQGIAPDRAVELLAQRKAQAVLPDCPQALVIGADTVVAVDGLILGKPQDAADAAAMLRRLSGKRHQVYTGVALCHEQGCEVFSCCTEVEFAALSEQEIAWYLATGEPFDKAGSYGIQGYGARFVRAVYGDYFNVMGLPIQSIYQKLGSLYNNLYPERRI
ncbi:MAG: septum formation protein Maf [Anaerotruncus sp.]|nr:septum formation protein Maf [Anaerotruncus sp.]